MITKTKGYNRRGLILDLAYRGAVSASGTCKDSSGNSNDGTCVGNAHINNQGVNFDGSGDILNCGNNTSLKSASRTFSCWIKATTLSNAYNTLTTENISSYVFAALIKSNGKLAFYTNTSSGGRSMDGTGTHTLTAGNWYFLVFEYIPTGMKMYVNGVLDASTIFSEATLVSTSADIIIGNDYYASRDWNGIIADIQFYNRALSSGEIKQIFNQNPIGE